jgi:branched-chain amino acid transport system substrate-binding protein
MPRIPALLFASLACLLLTACGSSDAESGARSPTAQPTVNPVTSVAADQPIVIGVSAALSGDQVNSGADIADAVELAVADFGGSVDGRPVTVMRLDDGCTDPEMAVAVARSFIAEPALAGVVGPMCTTGAQAANSVYEKAAIPHVSPSTTRAEISGQDESYFFRTAWRDDVQSGMQVRYAREALLAESAFVVDDGDPYGRNLADSFVEQFEDAGGRVLLRQRIKRGETDFSALVRQVLSAAPSVFVYEGFSPEGPLIIKALRDGGYTGTFIGPDGLLNARDFLPTAGPQGEGAVITGGATPAEDFVLRFTERFGRSPSTPFVLQAHDAATALLRAIGVVAEPQAGGALRIDRTRLAEALRAQEFDGLTGPIAFDARGDRRGTTARELGLTVYRVSNGGFAAIE